MPGSISYILLTHSKLLLSRRKKDRCNVLCTKFSIPESAVTFWDTVRRSTYFVTKLLNTTRICVSSSSLVLHLSNRRYRPDRRERANGDHTEQRNTSPLKFLDMCFFTTGHYKFTKFLCSQRDSCFNQSKLIFLYNIYKWHVC